MGKRRVLLKLLFLTLLVYSFYYITFIQTEKYESRSIIMIKDLSKEQSSSLLGSLLMGGTGSESMTDAMLLEVYIKSLDMYSLLDKEFNLTAYYTGNSIDILNRLSDSMLLPSYEESEQNLLNKYIDDLTFIYDEFSKTVEVKFAHASPEVAREVVESIITHAKVVLNFFEKKNSEVALSFLETQEKEKHVLFMQSLEELLLYQNQHKTIDPNVDIQLKSTILAGLESELIQKNVEYNSKTQYLNKSAAEMKLLKRNILYIGKSIKKIKQEMTGTESKEKLNVNMSNFALLKNKLEFDKQVYINILLKLEEAKVLVNQNTKNLIVVSHANVPDSYMYPNKIKDSFSLLIILGFIYGIITFVFMLIKDHKD